jgi:hypothetical protein
MNLEMCRLADWFRANKLLLNAMKSNYMFFTNVRIGQNYNYQIRIGNDLIERKTCVKFLGIHIDDHLTWHDHIKICKSKIAGSIYVISRIKHIIPRKYIRTLYFTMIYPYLSNGIQLWGSTYAVHRKPLIISKKRIIRIVTGAKYNEHTDLLFKNEGLLKLDDIYHVEISKIIFKYKQHNLPTPLMTMFTLKSEMHVRKTRQHDDLYVKKCRTTLATQHISCKGPQIWNSLPTEIKTLTNVTLKQFATKVTQYIIHGYGN